MTKQLFLIMPLVLVSAISFSQNHGDVYTGTYQMYSGTSYQNMYGVYPMKIEINYIERIDAYVIKYLYSEEREIIPINDLFVEPIRDYVYYSNDDQWGEYYLYLDDETGNELLLVSHDEDDNEPFIERFTRIENIDNNPYP